MIQISSGSLRGLKLKSPRGTETRPTTERTRQSLFNVLRNYRFQSTEGETPILHGAQVTDLYAGTGAWGIDAASNGAHSVHFVESSKAAQHVLTENLRIAQKALAGQADGDVRLTVDASDVSRAYQSIPLSRVVFADPPYRKGCFEILLQLEAKYSKVDNKGLFLIEEAADHKVDLELARPASLVLFDQKNYGDSVIYFFVKSSYEAGALSG